MISFGNVFNAVLFHHKRNIVESTLIDCFDTGVAFYLENFLMFISCTAVKHDSPLKQKRKTPTTTTAEVAEPTMTTMSTTITMTTNKCILSVEQFS